jgi:hypothetical protein
MTEHIARSAWETHLASVTIPRTKAGERSVPRPVLKGGQETGWTVRSSGSDSTRPSPTGISKCEGGGFGCLLTPLAR